MIKHTAHTLQTAPDIQTDKCTTKTPHPVSSTACALDASSTPTDTQAPLPDLIQDQIRRHSASALFMHWFNAACWLFLLCTGFAMLTNPLVQPIGTWWSDLWTAAFGAHGLFVGHILVGLVWISVYAAYTVLWLRKDIVPFVREITQITPLADMDWCVRKSVWLVLGPRLMQRVGLDPNLPPQGFYNAGQKLVALIAIVCSVGLAVTGVALLALMKQPATEQTLQILMLMHFCCAGLMTVFLPVHIYMAALAPGEAPALRSMLTGFVPASFAKHHNPHWYRRLQEKGAPQTQKSMQPNKGTEHHS